MKVALPIDGWNDLYLDLPTGDQFVDMAIFDANHTLIISLHSIYLLKHTSTYPVLQTTIRNIVEEKALGVLPVGSVLAEITGVWTGVNKRRWFVLLVTHSEHKFCVTLEEGISGQFIVINCSPYGGKNIKLREDLNVTVSDAVYLSNTAEEHFVLKPEGRMSRRHIVDHKDFIFIGSDLKLFKYNIKDLEKIKLAFVVEMDSHIQSLSIWNGLVVVSLATGQCYMYDEAGRRCFSVSCPSDLKCIVGSRNGLLGVSGNSLIQVHVALSDGQSGLFLLEYYPYLFIHNALSLERAEIPEEYLDALPLSVACRSKSGKIAISGRSGLCVTNDSQQWVILHPQLSVTDPITVTSMEFLDDDLLAVACVAHKKQTGELRIYGLSSAPISIVLKLSLPTPMFLLSCSPDKEIIVCDPQGSLRVAGCFGSGWRYSMAADLGKQCSQVHLQEGRLLIHTEERLYSLRSSQVRDNQLNGTVASAFLGEGNGRVSGFVVLSFNIVAVVLAASGSTQILFMDYSTRAQLASILMSEGVFVGVNEAYVYLLEGGEFVKRPVLGDLLVFYLSKNELNIAKRLIDTHMMDVLLETCLFKAWSSDLLHLLLPLLDNDIKMAVSRVARTLEYEKAIDFLSKCEFTTTMLYNAFFKDKNPDGMLLLFRLTVDDTSEEYLYLLVKVLIEMGRSEDLKSTMDLARNLQMDLSKSNAYISTAIKEAGEHFNLPDLKKLMDITSTTTTTSIEFKDPDKRTLIAAATSSLLLDPSIADWYAGNISGQDEYNTLLQSIKEQLYG